MSLPNRQSAATTYKLNTTITMLEDTEIIIASYKCLHKTSSIRNVLITLIKMHRHIVVIVVVQVVDVVVNFTII